MRAGLPHSEIHGSKGARPSPRLFAACHVLHRLSVPRHPPNALRRLISAAGKTALARLRAPLSGHTQASRRAIPQQSISRNNPLARDQASGIRRSSTPTPRPDCSGHLPLHNVQYPCGPSLSAQPQSRVSCPGPFSLSQLVEADGIEPTTSSLQS